MNELETKRLEVELIRVQAARAELEFKIIEREHDIIRLKDHVQAQLKREEELKAKLNEIKGE